MEHLSYLSDDREQVFEPFGLLLSATCFEVNHKNCLKQPEQDLSDVRYKQR